MTKRPPTPEDEAATRREHVQHYDGRRERLEAYARALEDGLAKLTGQPGGWTHVARLTTELDAVRQRAKLASRPRVSRGDTRGGHAMLPPAMLPRAA